MSDNELEAGLCVGRAINDSENVGAFVESAQHDLQTLSLVVRDLHFILFLGPSNYPGLACCTAGPGQTDFEFLLESKVAPTLGPAGPRQHRPVRRGRPDDGDPRQKYGGCWRPGPGAARAGAGAKVGFGHF